MSRQPHDETLSQSDFERDAALARGSRTNISRPFEKPSHIPGYDLIRPLGSGSFGEVWLALAANTGREVAIKIFTRRTGLDWELLRREVEKMAAVSTERRVVQLLEVGWEGEQPYFVMEYLPGGSLAETLDSSRASADEALEFFREIASALVYLHSKAILHCDLKPANVLLDGHGGIRLADFGQARASHERGSVAGTLFYMAPEQATPDARPDVRSDLYSLGAILFAMLTGRPPHATVENSRDLASSSTVTDRLERYRGLLMSSPSPLDHPEIQRVDKPLQLILKRCLDLDPSKRFANAQQVLNAVDLRRRRRQQRPLLAFGFLAPLVLWAGLAAVGFATFDATLTSARSTLIEQALSANSATARVAAAAVDYNLSAVERRVRREASRTDLRQLVETTSVVGSPLQAYAESLHETYRLRHFFSWIIADHQALALARAPFDPGVVGSSYAYREWFSGRVESLQGDLPVSSEPRTEPGLTLAFRSTAEGAPVLVSVAAPIRGDEGTDALGVLAATVHLDTFQEWLEGAESPTDGRCPERLVLLLNRGQLVRHPCPSDTAPALPVPVADFFQTESVQRLFDSESMMSESFEDPMQPGSVFLATIASLENHEDWTALVLQERRQALKPVRDLANRFRKLAWGGMGVGMMMVLMLYILLLRVIRSERP